MTKASYLMLIRHSAVLFDPDTPSHEWELSAEGRERCLKFTLKIAPFQPTHFITSQEDKAVETGAILGKALNISTQTAPNLHEQDRSNEPFLNNQKKFNESVAHFFSSPEELVFGRETAVQAKNRIIIAISQLLKQYPTDHLAIVTHGTVLTLFVSHYNPHLDPVFFWSKLKLPCAVLLELPGLAVREILLPEKR